MKRLNEIIETKTETEVTIFSRHTNYITIAYTGDAEGALKKFGNKFVPFYEIYEDGINIFI